MHKITKHFIRRAAIAAALAVLLAFSSVAALATEPRRLVPVGRAVGIRLESDGVMIVGVPEVCSDGETPSPAKKAGFRAGDTIVRMGKTEIDNGEQLKAAVQAARGERTAVQVRRGDELIQLEVMPHRAKSGDFSLGLYVRDGVSGIGTVTYYDPDTGGYGALGHAVNDGETGTAFTVREGAISHVTVGDVAKGKAGTPGQLHGEFDPDIKLGTIVKNTDCGIFGTAEPKMLASEEPLEVGGEDDIHTGEAYILSNVSGDEVRRYSVEISRVFRGGEADGRMMLVTVTDEELTAQTGGIVQGMSGSPIIQDGKLIGAVTHVLINDPLKGYGVSIEEMLKISEAA